MTEFSLILTGQTMNISNIDVRSMLPENLNHFFRYQGSLTTPPCYESILWTVFDTPITLSHNQVQQTGQPVFVWLQLLFMDCDCHRFKETSLFWLLCGFSSCLLCSDQETGGHSDGHWQQDPVERLSHCPAAQRPGGGVFIPATPWERKCVTCCDIVITQRGNIIYSSELSWGMRPESNPYFLFFYHHLFLFSFLSAGWNRVQAPEDWGSHHVSWKAHSFRWGSS